MRSTLWIFGLLAAASATDAATMGWRGDGTGKFPNADPPIHWGRVSKAVKALSYQAAPPKDGDTGKPMPDGVAREWLVLGPVPCPKDAKAEQDTLPDETPLAPAEGAKAGTVAWKKLAFDTATIDFTALFGWHTDAVAYAATNIHSPTGGGTSGGRTAWTFARGITSGS